MRHLSKCSSVFAACSLLLAVWFVFLEEQRPPARNFKGRLEDMLPSEAEIPGWKMKCEEIVTIPEMRRQVSEALNYDDAAYVSYIRDKDRISVYIAYWKPGRMSHRLIGGHTPDVCWVANGWEVLRKRSGVILPPVAGRAVQPVEAREMRFGNMRESVFFWHLVGAEVEIYLDAAPPWYAMFTDLVRHRLKQRQEQFFLRISSTLPEAGWQTEVVGQVVSKLKAANVPI